MTILPLTAITAVQQFQNTGVYLALPLGLLVLCLASIALGLCTPPKLFQESDSPVLLALHSGVTSVELHVFGRRCTPLHSPPCPWRHGPGVVVSRKRRRHYSRLGPFFLDDQVRLLRKIGVSPLLVLSLPDVGLLALDGTRFELLEIMRPLHAFFHHLPLLLLQIWSLQIYVPSVLLVALAFNVGGFVLTVSRELFVWVAIQPRGGAEVRDTKFPFGTTRAAEVQLLERLLVAEPREEPVQRTIPAVFFRPMLWSSSLLVLFSLVPQALTIFGLPFARLCLTNFLCAFGADPLSRRPSPSWWACRGFFLIPVNAFSFLLVALLFLPG